MEKKKMTKTILISLIFLLVMTFLQITSFANTTGEIYFKAVNNSDDTIISGLEVAVYQVSTTSNTRNVLEESFKNCTIDLNNLTENSLNELKEYAEVNAKPIFIEKTDAEGSFRLTNLNLGEYLVIQKNNFENYTMQTMLVTIPELTTENGLNYNVTVKPKIVNKVIKEEVPIVTEDVLPDTGVLNWPIQVLVVLGTVVFCVGWLKFYTDSKKKVN